MFLNRLNLSLIWMLFLKFAMFALEHELLTQVNLSRKQLKEGFY